MKFISKFLLLCALVSMSTLAFSNVKEDGAFFINEEQYEKAISVLKSELNQSPNNPLLQFHLGEAYFLLGRLDDARAAFNQAAVSVKSPYGFIGLGLLELKSGNKSQAIALFDKGVKLEKKNPAIYATVADLALRLVPADTATARVYLQRGESVSSKNAYLQLIKGDLSSEKKNYGAAANDYERVFLYDKENYVSYRNLGILFTKAKNYLDARKNFEESLRLAPNQVLGYKKFSELYYNYAQYAEAEKYYSIYYSKVNPSVDETERYAFILFFNKKYKEASELLDKVMAEKGDQANIAIYRVKGYISYETGEYAKGIEYMDKLFQAKKSDELLASDFAYNARLQAKSNNDSMAVVYYKSAIAKVENPSEYLDELAKIHIKNKKFDEASAVYGQLLAAGGDKSTVSFNVGKMYYQAADEQRQALFAITPVADSKGRVAPMPKEADGIKIVMTKYYNSADSAFAITNELSPSFATAYIWRGRIQSILDPEAKQTLAKGFYEKSVEVLNASADKSKLKKSFIECYNYLGSYYYFQSERTKGEEMKQNLTQSISYFEKVLELDAEDINTKDKIEKLKVALK